VGGGEVVLSWQSAASAQAAATGKPATSEAYAYRVQVSRATDPGFAKPLDDELLDSTSHVSAKLRYPDGQYVWRVQPVDASGHRLPWSSTGTFTRDGTAPTFTVGTAGTLPAAGPVQVLFSEPVTGVGARTVSMSGVLATGRSARTVGRALIAPGRPLLPGAGHTLIVTAGIRGRRRQRRRRPGAAADPSTRSGTTGRRRWSLGGT
jgi:hypothetical protein